MSEQSPINIPVLKLDPLANFRPLHDWVLVRKHFENNTGKIIRVNMQEERPTHGTVISCGPEATMVKPGDHVHFSYAAGTTFDYKGEKVSIIKQIDINGIIEDGND